MFADVYQNASGAQPSSTGLTIAHGSAKQHRFSPYADNGGSIVAIAGADFAIIASDTRLTSGYQIYTRNQPRLFNLTESTVLASTGCWCDILTFVKVMEARIKMYRYEHNRVMSTAAAAQMLAIQLYSKRFFPYYISNILVGLDADGRGAVYSYDPVGHMEKENFTAGGSSAALLQPLLDNQIGLKNMEIVPEEKKQISKEAAVTLIKDAFTSAAERDIHCGDSVLIKVVTKDGITDEIFQLRKD